MSFIGVILVFGCLSFAGAWVGDPFRPDETSATWRVTIIRGE